MYRLLTLVYAISYFWLISLVILRESVMAKLDFSGVNKSTSQSFHKQKDIIKKVLSGKSVVCENCAQTLSLVPKNAAGHAYVNCIKGCTNIELEVDI